MYRVVAESRQARMDPGPLRDVLTVVAGVATGILSAAFGVGGAVISTPGDPPAGRLGDASRSAPLCPRSCRARQPATLRYSREQLIDWHVVGWTAPAGIVASVGGSLLSRVVPGDGHWLMVLTALLLGFTAWRMARPPEAPPAPETDVEMAPHRADPRTARPPACSSRIGAAAGLMSGLLGVGGGIVMVPAFSELARIPIKMIIATSLACVGLFAIPGTITHAVTRRRRLADCDRPRCRRRSRRAPGRRARHPGRRDCGCAAPSRLFLGADRGHLRRRRDRAP